MTLQEQLEKAEAQLKEIFAGRPKVYRAWENTWATFREDPAAYHKTGNDVYCYDIAKNKVVNEVMRLKKIMQLRPYQELK